MSCRADSLRNSVRDVSRSRNMRSPDFSASLGDWELTMVAVEGKGWTLRVEVG